jgi:hypothetical protein
MYFQEVGAVNCNATSIGIMNRISNHIAVKHFSIQVEVNRISSNDFRLAHIPIIIEQSNAYLNSAYSILPIKPPSILP